MIVCMVFFNVRPFLESTVHDTKQPEIIFEGKFIFTRSGTMDSRQSGDSYLTTPSQSRDNLDEFDSISFGGDYSDKAQLIP